MWTGNGNVISDDAVRITTVSVHPAIIRVKTDVPAPVKVEILKNDIIVAKGCGKDAELVIPDAELWSDETPELYSCRVKTEEDVYECKFGIRMITRDDNGLYVNGQKVKLRGGCMHHDSGILGAATYDEMEFRRIRKLKEAGFNAIRSAHNPVSRATLEACDRLGMYVIDEAWDMWYQAKSKYDYAQVWCDQWKKDVRAMVQKDYNHPSVLCYSIGNELSEPAAPEGLNMTREITGYIRELDPTRMVTAGVNFIILQFASTRQAIYKKDGSGRNDLTDCIASKMNSYTFNMLSSVFRRGIKWLSAIPGTDCSSASFFELLDIAGYNYADNRYKMDRKKHPKRLMMGTESFPRDIAANWKKYPWLCGDFMWSAWDYLGEAGIGAWTCEKAGKKFGKPYPWLLADVGAFDILGNPNGELFYAQAVWNIGKKVRMAVQPLQHNNKHLYKSIWRVTNAIPSWSFRGCEGNKATVEVYTTAHKTLLYLDGRLIGTKRVKNCRAIFKVRYQPGRIEAVGFNAQGKEIGRDVLTSACGALNLKFIPEPINIHPGEIYCVSVQIQDSCGVLECNEDQRIYLEVKNGELLAFGSAAPCTEDRFDRGECTTWYGQAMAVIRTSHYEEVELKAKCSLGEYHVLFIQLMNDRKTIQ